MDSFKNLFCINPDGFLNNVKQIHSPNQDARPSDEKISLLVIHNISLPPNKIGNTYIEDFFSNSLNIKSTSVF